MIFPDIPATGIQGCGSSPCAAAKEKDDALARDTAHALQRITGKPADQAATEKLDTETPYNLPEKAKPSCQERAEAIITSGTLSRFNRYREALPAAYAAEDMNTLGDAADDEGRQEERQKKKCLTRLPDSAPELNRALGLPGGTIQDRDLRDDKIGFRAGLYRNEADGKLILVPRDTEPNSLADWQTNTDNGQGLGTRQYNAMRDLTKTLDKKGVRFDLAGYSKGGGQAQFAGLFATGSQVRIFNSAGLPDNALEGTGQSSFQPLAARTRAFNAEGDFLTYMNNTADPGKQLDNARFLRNELAGEGAGIHPINIVYRNPAMKPAVNAYEWCQYEASQYNKSAEHDPITCVDPDPMFSKAKADYLQGIDSRIEDAAAKKAKGEPFRFFPPIRAGSEETLPNSMSLTGRLLGATKDEANLGKLAQHKIGNVIGGLEKTKKADQEILQKFTDDCPEN